MYSKRLDYLNRLWPISGTYTHHCTIISIVDRRNIIITQSLCFYIGTSNVDMNMCVNVHVCVLICTSCM